MKKNTKLKKASREIKYEIDMFNELPSCFDYLTLFPTELRQDAHDALLESLLQHIYCLFRFFYQGEVEIKNNNRNKRKKDDMIAEDFNINRSQFRRERTPKKDLKFIEKKRNKQLAHLTYNRIYRNKRTKGWDLIIMPRMKKTITAFFNSLPNEYKKFFISPNNEYAVRKLN